MTDAVGDNETRSLSPPVSVKWLGLSALYSPDERALMAALPAREQTFIHALKALTQGEIQIQGELAEPVLCVQATPPPVYTDPEDIPFGESAPRRLKPSESIIVLRWTKDKGRALKTKKAALHKMKVWKRWYERRGWIVKGFEGESMIARAPDGERHSITLRVFAKKKGPFPAPRSTT